MLAIGIRLYSQSSLTPSYYYLSELIVRGFRDLLYLAETQADSHSIH